MGSSRKVITAVSVEDLSGADACNEKRFHCGRGFRGFCPFVVSSAQQEYPNTTIYLIRAFLMLRRTEKAANMWMGVAGMVKGKNCVTIMSFGGEFKVGLYLVLLKL